MLVELEWLDAARDEACDRLITYHGRAEEARFAALEVLDAKWERGEIDIESLITANPVRREEGKLCRGLNADRGRLGAMVRRRLGREVMEPTAVGVDAWGVDVRTRTGLVRLEFDSAIEPGAVGATIERWMSGA